MSLPNLILDGYTGSDSGAMAVGNVRTSFPFSAMGDQTTILYEQEYQQLGTNFTALAVNSVCPWDAAAYLIEETERRPVLGGVVQWTRRYSYVPISRDDASSLAYQFPGLIAAYLDVTYFNVTIRNPITWTVTCRVRQDYFLVGTGGTYPILADIPTIQKTYFYLPLFNGILNVSPGQGSDVTILVSTHASAPTIPTVETYQDWMTGAATGQTGANPGEIIAEASQLTRWKGQIFCRTTKYIPAR